MIERTCPKCGGNFAAEWGFCPKDATALSAPREADPLPALKDPNLGRIIASRFVLQGRLGSGAMGTVYLATHRGLERYFAVKLLHREQLGDEKARQIFRREAHVLGVVDHPHMVRLYDYGYTDRGEPFLVMEFVDGPTLYEVQKASAGGKLPPDQAVDVTLQVLRALRHAHSCGVIHRDIKPENILLSQRDSRPDWVKIVDFGLAKALGQAPLTRPGDRPSGTAQYMAPEMWQDTVLGPPADLYAVGVLLHDLVVGQPPFGGEPAGLMFQHLTKVPQHLSDRDPNLRVPTGLDRLVARLLLKDPAQRPDAVTALAELEQVRMLLPRRTLRGLLLAQTMILMAGQPKASGDQATAGRPGVKTVLLSGVPGSQTLRDRVETVLSPRRHERLSEVVTHLLPRLVQVDRIEEGRQRAGSDLEDELQAFQQSWPQGWSAAAEELARRLEGLRAGAEQLGLELALCEDNLGARERGREERAAAARQASMLLSQRLQEEGQALSEQERRELESRLQEQDWPLLGLMNEDPSEQGLRKTRGVMVEQIAQAQGERDRVLMQLARLVAEAQGPKEMQSARNRVGTLLQELEHATVLLGQMIGEAGGIVICALRRAGL